jgi:signal transduction histidine kinase
MANMLTSNKHIEWFISAKNCVDLSNEKILLDLVSRAIIQARENEREEIAKELHDNINQLIMASKLMIDTARNEAENRRELLKKSSDTLNEAIGEIRKLSYSMTITRKKDFGLLEAIGKLVYMISLSKHTRVVLKYNRVVEELLDLNQKIQVYRIIQEQFTNIAKHAEASKVVLLIGRKQDIVRIKIKDNGIGFDVCQKRNGIGLSNIGKRVEKLNGGLNIQSAINEGSTLDVWFRINAA